jgi:hypothetical protein
VKRIYGFLLVKLPLNSKDFLPLNQVSAIRLMKPSLEAMSIGKPAQSNRSEGRNY